MSDERKKAGAGFWAAVAAVLLVAYIASIGPAQWIALWVSSTWGWPDWAQAAFVWFYAPVLWSMTNMPNSIGKAVSWYISLGI